MFYIYLEKELIALGRNEKKLIVNTNDPLCVKTWERVAGISELSPAGPSDGVLVSACASWPAFAGQGFLEIPLGYFPTLHSPPLNISRFYVLCSKMCDFIFIFGWKMKDQKQKCEITRKRICVWKSSTLIAVLLIEMSATWDVIGQKVQFPGNSFDRKVVFWQFYSPSDYSWVSLFACVVYPL